MTDDDLRREAQDPTTSGERLREIVWHVHHVRTAALANPSLPLDLLRRILFDGTAEAAGAAWYNPAVPALLMSQASRHYEAAAVRALRASALAEGLSVIVRTKVLETVVKPFALHPLRESKTGSFARHLAGLFGLPWPEP